MVTFRGDDARLANFSSEELQKELTRLEAAEEASRILYKYKDPEFRQLLQMEIARNLVRPQAINEVLAEESLFNE
jgi:hypothetical protein